MPMILNIKTCSLIPSFTTFTGAYGNLHAEPGSPSWFFITNVSPGNYSVLIYPNTGAVGTWSINLLDNTNTIVGFVLVESAECVPSYEYDDVCIGDFQDQSPIERPPTWTEENPVIWYAYSAPSWFNLYSMPGQMQGFSFVPESVGTTTVILRPSDNSYNFMIIEINVVNCFTNYSVGCTQDAQLNIAWFNRYGGWQSYIFTGNRTLGVDIGDTRTFKQSGVIKWVAIEDVYDNAQQPSGYISLAHLDFVKEMKYTIQAYEYNPDTLNWDIPILINADSFILKREGNGFYSYDFIYRYATEIPIQNQ